MQVQLAKQDDFEKVYEICSAASGVSIDKDVFQKAFTAAISDDKRKIFIALSQEGVIGYADLQTTVNLTRCEMMATITDIYVKPEYRGNGIASGIIIHLAREARKLGCSEIIADCPKINIKTHEFFERHSFVKAKYGFVKSMKG